MTDFSPRLFTSDAAIVRLGEGLLACSLAKEDWTHEAHLAACLYLLTQRPDVNVDAEIAGIISRFNESVGGVNDDENGYHDTITRAWLVGVRLFLRAHPEGGLADRVNACWSRRWGVATGRSAFIVASGSFRWRHAAAL